MPALIGGFVLSPTPVVTITRQKQSAEDGTNLGQSYQITLRGNLVAVPPGTTPVAEPARLGILLAKQKQLAQAFGVDGKTLEIFSPDGTNVIRCNPRVLSVEFAEGIWVDRTEYTVTLEAPNLYADDFIPEFNVTDINDSWQIQEAGFTTEAGGTDLVPVWQLTHTVSAKGLPVYDANGALDPEKVSWKQARDWVLKRLTTSDFDTKPFDTKDELNIADGGEGYNHTRTEDVDMIGGTFSMTENWILARGMPALEDYTISVRKTPEEQTVTSISVQGTIRGLATGINQLQSRSNNALSYFNNSVKNNLVTRARNSAPGITLSDYGVSGSIDINYAEGTVAYNYDFSDRPTATGNDTVYDTYTVSKKTSIDEAEITVTVQGTIAGRLAINEPPSSLLKYERAKTYFDAISSGTEMLNRANKSGVAGLKRATLNSNIDYNFFEGTISYSYDFNNRLNDTARNEFTMNIRSSREERKTVVSIEGTITGLREADDDPISRKYDNALSFWSGWEPQIRTKATNFGGGISLNINPASKSRGDNPYQGTINYNYEYDTDKAPTIPGALVEQVSVNETNPSDVFAVIPVLGRLAGPILQDIGSKKEKAKSITIEVVMDIGNPRPNSDGLVSLYRPDGRKVFVDRDEESWTENTGHYTRNVTWIYE